MPLFGGGKQDPQELVKAVMAMIKPTPSGAQRWNYLQLFGNRNNQTLSSSDGRNWPFGADNAVLLALGMEGWELLSLIPPSPVTEGFWYVFKRPLTE